MKKHIYLFFLSILFLFNSCSDLKVTADYDKNADYFSVDVNAFTLDNYEKSKIDKYLRSNGNIQLTRKYSITSPDLSYYVMNIFVIKYFSL